MKLAKNIKVGLIVEVPYYCFAPMRSGWNGWLFTLGEVIKIGKTSQGNDTTLVRYINTHKKVENGICATCEQYFLFSRCFDPSSPIEFCKNSYERYNHSL